MLSHLSGIFYTVKFFRVSITEIVAAFVLKFLHFRDFNKA